LIAGCFDVLAREVQLKSANARQTSGWRAYLSRKIRQRRNVVADHRRGIGELRARQLHTITGIAGEADSDGFNFFQVLFRVFYRGFDNGAHDYSLSVLLIEWR